MLSYSEYISKCAWLYLYKLQHATGNEDNCFPETIYDHLITLRDYSMGLYIVPRKMIQWIRNQDKSTCIFMSLPRQKEPSVFIDNLRVTNSEKPVTRWKWMTYFIKEEVCHYQFCSTSSMSFAGLVVPDFLSLFLASTCRRQNEILWVKAAFCMNDCDVSKLWGICLLIVDPRENSD